MTAEELLDRVKRIRAQKEELDKEEQGLIKVLTKMVDKLKTEINTLNGVAQPVALPATAFTDSIPSPSIGAPRRTGQAIREKPRPKGTRL